MVKQISLRPLNSHIISWITAPIRSFLAWKFSYVLIFFSIALLTMWDLLTTGHLFAIDMTYGPESPYLNLVNHWNGKGPNLSTTSPTTLIEIIYYIFTYALSFIIPSWAILKISLVFIIALSGISMYCIVPTQNRYARYYAGLLYMVNPFIYVRLLSGSFWLLWAYAFLPFALKSFIDLLHSPNLKNSIRCSLWLSLIAASDHILFMAVGLLCLFFLTSLIWRHTSRIKLTLAFLGTIVLFGALNASWIFSILVGTSDTQGVLTFIDSSHLELFAPSPGSNNAFVDVISMHGFWREGYYDPRDHLWGWQFLCGVMIFFCTYGIFTRNNHQHGIYFKGMIVATLGAVILAIGVSQEQTAILFRFLHENVPFFSGFRDSHKFVALVALSYSFFGALGISALWKWMRIYSTSGKLLVPVVGLIILVIPMIYTYPLFFGLHGQMSNVDYPSDYYKVNSFLDSQHDSRILFLPWHQHMIFNWIGEDKVVSPADTIFSKTVIKADNLEIGDVYSESDNPVSKYIETLLTKGDTIQDLGHFIAPLSVEYVILAKEVDWEKYLYLEQQKDLELVMDTPHLQVFLNHSYSQDTTTIRESAQSLDWSLEEIDNIESSLVRYDDAQGAGTGYIVSFMLLAGILIYLPFDKGPSHHKQLSKIRCTRIRSKS